MGDLLDLNGPGPTGMKVFQQHLVQMPFFFLQYPLTHVRVLVQIGHEPVPPRLVSWLGKEYYVLPSGPAYVRYLYRQGGMASVYRGWWVKNINYMVYSVVRMQLQQLFLRLRAPPSYVTDGEDVAILDRAKNLGSDMCYELICNCGALVAAFPLTVVHTRMLSQIIGNETTYDTFFGGLAAVFSDGDSGSLMEALIPALIREISITAIWVLAKHMVAYFLPPLPAKTPAQGRVQYYVTAEGRATEAGQPAGVYQVMPLGETDSEGYLDDSDESFEGFARSPAGHFVAVQLVHMLAMPWLYPLSHASTRMMVQNVLAAGRPPSMPIYTGGWRDCLRQLSAQGMANVGSRLLTARRLPSPKSYSFLNALTGPTVQL